MKSSACDSKRNESWNKSQVVATQGIGSAKRNRIPLVKRMIAVLYSKYYQILVKLRNQNEKQKKLYFVKQGSHFSVAVPALLNDISERTGASETSLRQSSSVVCSFSRMLKNILRYIKVLPRWPSKELSLSFDTQSTNQIGQRLKNKSDVSSAFQLDRKPIFDATKTPSHLSRPFIAFYVAINLESRNIRRRSNVSIFVQYFLGGLTLGIAI